MRMQHWSAPLSTTKTKLFSQDQTHSTILRGDRTQPTPEPPAVVYMENIMPTDYGYTSAKCSLDEGADETPDPITLNTVHQILGSYSNPYIIAWANGWRITDPAFTSWANAPMGSSSDLQIATVHGVSYIFSAHMNDLYVYNEATLFCDSQTVLGLTLANITGFTAAAGYLIAFEGNTIYWSSVSDPLDFVPSLVTGAGSMSGELILDNILFGCTTQDGCYLYTATGIFELLYTGNSNLPFNIARVEGATGWVNSWTPYGHAAGPLFTYNLVTYDIQQLQGQKAETVLREVSDLFFAQKKEYWDATYKRLLDDSPQIYQMAVYYARNRYAVISHGDLNLDYYTDMIVIDTLTGRVGKLSCDHVGAIEHVGNFLLISPYGQPYEFPGAYEKWTADEGVLVFGPVQYAPGVNMTLQGIVADGTYSTADPPVVSVLSSYEGEWPSIGTVLTLVSGESNSLKTWKCRLWGRSHRIAFEGAIKLNTLTLDYTVDGER